MSRPLRILVPGAVYHVTSRGNRREVIYADDRDRTLWLDVLAEVCRRLIWRVHAWCQMNNHYHLVVETPDANLSVGMRQLNGVFSQGSNRIHSRVGHVFQGRFHAVLVERQTHLLEVARYVVLNPVRANLAGCPEEWPWSSYRSMIGAAPSPPWLETRWILSQFCALSSKATMSYIEFVRAGFNSPGIGTDLSGDVVVGSKQFSEDARRIATTHAAACDLTEVPRAQRRGPPPPLAHYAASFSSRREAMARAYADGGHTMRAIGAHFGVHRTTVARAVDRFKQSAS